MPYWFIIMFRLKFLLKCEIIFSTMYGTPAKKKRRDLWEIISENEISSDRGCLIAEKILVIIFNTLKKTISFDSVCLGKNFFLPHGFILSAFYLTLKSLHLFAGLQESRF